MSAAGGEPTGTPGDDSPAPGLTGLYSALARSATRHDLDALAVAVDDPDLGHQCFAAGPEAPAALAQLSADPRLRWTAVPARREAPAELDALRALAATALRLGRADPGADPGSALETFVRALPHVTTVLRSGAVVEVVVDAGHANDVVARLASTDLPGTGAVVLREGAVEPTGGARRPRGRVELLAVRSLPESGELEVHLRAGDHRTIGRGPLARAGSAAADATLAALAGLDPEPGSPPPWRVGWVRTIDTTTDREFLVAVMIRRDGERSLYGLAGGASPIEAAARATLHACNRVAGWAPPP